MYDGGAVTLLVLVLSLGAYAGLAAAQRWWFSAIAASVVALLLWRRHPRARFAAYVFFTALALRLAATGVWALAVYPVIAVGFMQTAAARRLWPPIAPGWRREPGDRMRRS